MSARGANLEIIRATYEGASVVRQGRGQLPSFVIGFVFGDLGTPQ